MLSARIASQARDKVLVKCAIEMCMLASLVESVLTPKLFVRGVRGVCFHAAVGWATECCASMFNAPIARTPVLLGDICALAVSVLIA